MKIAVTYEAGLVFQHFGHTAAFKIYEVENNDIVRTQVVETAGHGHGALGAFLSALGVDTVICGGIGAGAQMALANAGIRFFGGVHGDADDAVQALLSGVLNFNPNVRCDHHDHGHDHDCGSHGCGSHGCGSHCGH